MGTDERPEDGIEVPLVVYKGDERIVVGTAWVNTSSEPEIYGYVSAVITAEIHSPEIMDRLRSDLGEFSFGITPRNPSLFKFKDVDFRYDIWGNFNGMRSAWVDDGPTIQEFPEELMKAPLPVLEKRDFEVFRDEQKERQLRFQVHDSLEGVTKNLSALPKSKDPLIVPLYPEPNQSA